MNKNILQKIIDYANNKNISEYVASKEITGKICNNLTYWKKVYNLPLKKHIKGERIYNVNDNYFSLINPINSYYAGFIAADGSIDKTNKNLNIKLSIKDENFLKQLKYNISSTYKLYYGYNILNNKKFKNVSFHILSEQIVNDLYKNFNITKQKTNVYIPPMLETIYKDCFIIGVIDGDGSIGLYNENRHKSKRLHISCVGTYETLLYIKQRFEEILQDKTSNIFIEDKTKNFGYYIIASKKARTIFKYYYENYIIKYQLPTLTRKWSNEIYNYCVNYKNKDILLTQKGVNVFNLKGKLLYKCNKLKDAEKITGVAFSRISALCKKNSNLYESNGFMFSRSDTMEPYILNKCINKKYKDNILKGITNIEDAQSENIDNDDSNSYIDEQ